MPEPADGSNRRRPSRRYGGIDAELRVAARREQLLRAGYELFGTRGVLTTGVKDICREAGLTDRYFYESFVGTRELFVTVFDAVVRELFDAVAAAVEAEPAAGDRKLRAGIGTFLEALAADRRTLRIVFAEPASAQAEGHLRESLRRFAELVAETARRARPDGAPAASIEVYSHAVVGMLRQVITEQQEGRLALPMTDLVDHCTALAAAGLRALYAGELGKKRQ
ncbi:TetR/AcrR family transcriptional regulator [Nocardia sp. NPDC051570]|uniref:TetR/AcrR family transcriptional regulator n=1 Tax=Nocardia sp. NPDC051570 TaxID=3364324 RepID=UPI0037ADA209